MAGPVRWGVSYPEPRGSRAEARGEPARRDLGPQGPIAHVIRTPRVPYTKCARTIGAARWPWSLLPLRALLLLPVVFLLLRLPPPTPPPVPLLLNLENIKPSALRQRSCPGRTPPFWAVQRPHENAMEREALL